jgi:hypothetical protein
MKAAMLARSAMPDDITDDIILTPSLSSERQTNSVSTPL